MAEHVIYVNGAFVPEAEARISVMDHAVLYGDGVFDTVVAWNGKIFKLDAHIERFFRSMQAIALDFTGEPRRVARDRHRLRSGAMRCRTPTSNGS